MRQFYITFSVLAVLGIVSITVIEKGIHEDENKKYLGTKIALDSDTLIVVDYSYFSSKFTLSSGIEVDSDLIKNTKL